MKTRCKFRCNRVGRIETWNGREMVVAHSAELSPVTGKGSEENELFWEATPSGSLKVDTIKDANFEVGKEYYLDITLVEDNSESS